eukprot:scpid56092/ scgid19678/ 
MAISIRITHTEVEITSSLYWIRRNGHNALTTLSNTASIATYQTIPPITKSLFLKLRVVLLAGKLLRHPPTVCSTEVPACLFCYDLWARNNEQLIASTMKKKARPGDVNYCRSDDFPSNSEKKTSYSYNKSTSCVRSAAVSAVD